MLRFAPLLAATFLTQAEPPTVTPQQIVAALESAVTDSIAGAEPSVVTITRARNPEGAETLAVRGRAGAGPRDEPRFVVGVPDLSDPAYLALPGDYGCGVVVGAGGEILTAYHVVQGSVRIFVRMPGTSGFDAEVIAADPRSDLAVIAPRLAPGQEPPRFSPLPLGDADQLRKGAFLIALGNPYNTARDGRASASWGILSNTARRIMPPVDEGPELRQMFRHQPTLLQLDAKLNLGMSGGAVVNLKGELVGITTNGGNAEGYDAQAGYAIPIDGVGRRIVETLRQGREVEYGFLGIRLDPTLPNVVGGVEPGTPAAEGDLIVGDVIVAVNDFPVDPEAGLSLALSRAPVGRPVRLKIMRRDDPMEKTVLLSKYPIAGEVIATTRPEEWRGVRIDYTSILAGNTANSEILKAMAQGSVAVVEVTPGTPAETAGLKKGQVITKVEGQPVRTPTEFVAAVKGKTGPVKLDTATGEVTVPAR